MEESKGPVIYFIADEAGLVKIGYTTRSADDRLRELQTGNGNKLRLLTYIRGGRDIELMIHAACQRERVEGEWFHRRGIVRSLISFLELFKSEPGSIMAAVVDSSSEDDLDGLILFCRIAKKGL